MLLSAKIESGGLAKSGIVTELSKRSVALTTENAPYSAGGVVVVDVPAISAARDQWGSSANSALSALFEQNTVKLALVNSIESKTAPASCRIVRCLIVRSADWATSGFVDVTACGAKNVTAIRSASIFCKIRDGLRFFAFRAGLFHCVWLGGAALFPLCYISTVAFASARRTPRSQPICLLGVTLKFTDWLVEAANGACFHALVYSTPRHGAT